MMSSSNRESTDLAEDGTAGAPRKRERDTEMGWGGAVGMRRGGREPSCPKSCRQPSPKARHRPTGPEGSLPQVGALGVERGGEGPEPSETLPLKTQCG